MDLHLFHEGLIGFVFSFNIIPYQFFTYYITSFIKYIKLKIYLKVWLRLYFLFGNTSK